MKCLAYSSFIRENSERSVMKTVVLTTRVRPEPADFSTSSRFESALAVWGANPLSSLPETGSVPN
jgi:hypothetical protein